MVCICNHYSRTNQNLRSVMVLTSHISCIPDDFSSYRVSFSLIYLNWCPLTNQIYLMNLKIMGLDPGPPVSVGSSGESVGSVIGIGFGGFVSTGI